MRLPPCTITIAASVALAFASAAPCAAQELREQPTPFTTWLDFVALSQGKANPSALPIWIESIQRAPAPVGKTIFRLRIRHVGALEEQFELRTFFVDAPGKQPRLSGWTETGANPMPVTTLGEGLGVDASASVIVPGAAIDYLDIEVDGNGANLRGALVTSLRSGRILHALDFDLPAPVQDLFGAPPPAQPGEDDLLLFGRVRATLDATPMKLDAVRREGAYEFAINNVPLLAAVAVEILGADPERPVVAWMNDHYLGPVTINFPDLADPGFRAASHPFEKTFRFRYTGWLRGQIMLPASALQSGTNTLTVQLPAEAAAVVLRAMEIELKYPSRVFDYDLQP
jgi:hypothetical protein